MEAFKARRWQVYRKTDPRRSLMEEGEWELLRGVFGKLYHVNFQGEVLRDGILSIDH